MEEYISRDEFYIVSILILFVVYVLGVLIFEEFEKVHNKLK